MGDVVRLPAVSLTEPWASLVVAGVKTLETRKGPLLSGFTGPLVIHRTKADPVPFDLSPFDVTRFDVLATRPPGWPDDDRGMALGVVFVRRTHRPGELTRPGGGGLLALGAAHVLGDLQRRACFHDIEARYLSDLTHAAWFPRPIPAKGAQHRFAIGVPRAYLPAWAVPS